MMQFWWLWQFIFLFSGVYLLYKMNKNEKEGEIKSQFVITGSLLMIFYIVWFLSGVCTILNFMWRWIF